MRETDVVSRYATTRITIEPLRLLDRFPSFFEWCEVPALALPADNPKSALRRIESQSLPDRKRLERLVAAERFVAEKTGRVHCGLDYVYNRPGV